jgi:hypothetical protein
VYYLREFWIPLLLFLAATALTFVASYSGLLWRRAMLSAAVIMFALAILVFIWEDPVRGPFAYLVHPRATDKFTVWAGVGFDVPYKELGKGFNLSRLIGLKPKGASHEPFELWLQKNWPIGWRLKLKAYSVQGDLLLSFDEQVIQYQGPGTDLNYDDKALEFIISENGYPAFQLVFAGDGDVYINANLASADGKTATIMNGEKMRVVPTNKLTPEMVSKRIFKYPSYIHKGERI